MNRKLHGNRRIKRAIGFHRAWLIADQFNRLRDSAGAVLTQALVTRWLSEQRSGHEGRTYYAAAMGNRLQAAMVLAYNS